MSNLNFLHSGGNKVTLSAPTSDPSSNPNFKLPQSDGSAGQVLKTDGNGNLSWVTPGTATTNGITVADQWKITSGFSGDSDLTSNWARDTDRNGGNVGSAMTQSSGIFTFPSTGIYLVTFQARTYIASGNNNREYLVRMYITADNSTYEETAQAATNQYNSGSNTHTSAQCSKILDITNTSNVKVKFKIATDNNNAYTYGSTDTSYTFARFIRLGDT